ncbi:hypothetical protein TRSC58_07603 [Trypanosoma rangeli SC58]|uniref:Secreted protein n=1 Tax=Trypanosoma rangeli SC58 TaxID=429131 RepID=A0A061IRT1_TRYRA|nr:hypothetical protein TRSC58_07603 [Trypanosoma rangeli SC58]
MGFVKFLSLLLPRLFFFFFVCVRLAREGLLCAPAPVGVAANSGGCCLARFLKLCITSVSAEEEREEKKKGK